MPDPLFAAGDDVLYLGVRTIVMDRIPVTLLGLTQWVYVLDLENASREPIIATEESLTSAPES